MKEVQSDHILNQQLRRMFQIISSGFFIFILYAALLPFNLVDAPSKGFIGTLLSSATNAPHSQWINHVIFNSLLTFFVSAYCHLSYRKVIWFIMYIMIISFGILVEYLQMYSGGRGSSLVDIYANLGGLIFGALLWLLLGKFTVDAARYLLKEKTLSLFHIKRLYLIFVATIILFPFDFYINELQFRVAYATKGIPLFATDDGGGMGLISIFSSILLLLPLGVLYRSSAVKRPAMLIIKVAFILLFLEIIQFFEMSGQSSLLSFIYKFIGFTVGYYLGRFLDLTSLLVTLVKIKKTLLLTSPVFLLLVLYLKGFSFNEMASFIEISSILKDMSFLPFAYYATVSSGAALLSFIFNFAIFIPVGGYMALYRLSKGDLHHSKLSNLMTIGMIIAMGLEALILLWGLNRPDVTNIIIAMVALPIGYYAVIMVKNAADSDSVI